MAPVTRSIPTPATFRPRAPSARTVHRRQHEHTDMLPESIKFSAPGGWRFAMAFAHSHPRAAAEMSRVPGGVRAAVDGRRPVVFDGGWRVLHFPGPSRRPMR